MAGRPRKEEKRALVKKLRKSGRTYHEIAKRLNMSESLVQYYLSDKVDKRKKVSSN